MFSQRTHEDRTQGEVAMKLPSKRVWMYSGVVGLLSATIPFGGVAFAQAKPQMADDVFKNIQVLKGLTVDEFMGTMGLFSAALNVCCGDCHTGAGTSNPKWEDDPPRKKTARAMIQMVQTINRTSFQGRQVVTCWTCHRGQLSPAVTTPLDFAYGDAVVVLPDLLPRATSGGSTLDQIFTKYIQALGGQAKVDALTSYHANGKSLL